MMNYVINRDDKPKKNKDEDMKKYEKYITEQK